MVSVGLREPADLVAELLDLISLTGWTVQHRAGRTVVAPALAVARLQGWKLHVSATPSNAPEVLAACVPVLVESGTAFAFVATAAGLAELNGPRAPRAGAGKFLTACPASDELFRELARRLDEVTAGQVGPAILSDRAYRSGGVVYYRYGAFGEFGVRDNDGRYRRCLVDPDGNLVEDRCEPVFRPPAWVELPFGPVPERAATPAPGAPAWPTGGTASNWSVASMQVLGTSAAEPETGAAGTAGSAGGGPGGPAGPGVPVRSGGSTEQEGPAGSGGPARPGERVRLGGVARSGVDVRLGGVARSGGPAGSGGPVGPAGAAGSTGAVGSTGTWEPVGPAGPAEVLIGGRYAVTGAIRQANKGGVYRARDLRTGVDVLIKEARPYVGADASDRDVRDLLGHEARVLRHLLPLGVTPRPLREFVQGDHRFLVEELLAGRPLSADPPDPSTGGPVPLAAGSGRVGWYHLLDRLARLVGSVHAVGVVLRELAPENVLLLPDGELRLVDLELAALRTGGRDDWSYLDLRHFGEAGFVAPEQWQGATPDPAADLFSLGVLALWLAGRVWPVDAGTAFAGASAGPGDLPARSPEELVSALMEPSFGGPPVPALLRRIVSGLMRVEPADRIGLDEVVALCAVAAGSPATGRPATTAERTAVPHPGPNTVPDDEPNTVPDGCTGLTVASLEAVETLPGPLAMPPESIATLSEPAWSDLVEEAVRRLDPRREHGSTSDSTDASGTRADVRVRPTGVHPSGRPRRAGQVWAGPGPGRQTASEPGPADVARSVAALTRLVVAGTTAGDPERPVRAAPVLDRLLDRLLYPSDRGWQRLPGLAAGSAATVWALCDAGRLLGRPHLVDRAVELALRQPVRWPDPGLGYGLAGLGSGLLHLWRHTYLPVLRERITAVARQLLDTVDPGGAMVWTVPPSFDSVRAGLRTYDLAGGTAGIGAFLLAAGQLLGRRDLAAAAVRCAETLLDAARTVDGTLCRPNPSSDAGPGQRSWSGDPAGIGAFLCRAYVHTGDSRYRAAAVAAAHAVVTSGWTRHRNGGVAPLGGGSGGAGVGGRPVGPAGLRPGTGSAAPADGEFLLDLARATGDVRYAAWAEALAARWWAAEVRHPGHTGWSDGPWWTAAGGADPAGRLAFLLRLRLGGARLLHPDPATESGYPGTAQPMGAPAGAVGIGAWRTGAGGSTVPCAGGTTCRC
ncbi:lanthionine synthetase LanC family protein [Micromonospora sp. WMMD1102]|uniref:class III lanthionine synthetase LanKC N-terminal domain-containing protein n=1 Tax=Micromonospora sp. WMMD1102 TaxID=3016105 RepID=UPI0024151B5D|nr:lanthionine synthetase LanC family protein [Micromonospora sp. WMMD1102]MDG4786241.1 lanthionine synthetase LanC family protein [Micromonospora sp. WMMD1102]